jgi:hypothetical protein
MPTKVNVKGNRSLRKSSRKSSKKTSKKGLDFTSVLKGDMEFQSEMMGMNPMGNPMMMNPMGNQMENPMMSQMGNPMGMNMMGNMMGMPMGPSMGMPVGDPSYVQSGVMMGKDQNVDPLHVQFMVPQNQNLNINNYGISREQLMSSSSQASGLSSQFGNMHMGHQQSAMQQPMQQPVQQPVQQPMQQPAMQQSQVPSMQQYVNGISETNQEEGW